MAGDGRVTLGVVGSACGGLDRIRPELVVPFHEMGWDVVVTLTPTAASWLVETGEFAALEQETGYPVRVLPRLPGQVSPHPKVDCLAMVPASANSVAKLALGIADNQALMTLGEALGVRTVPVVVFPRINAAQARHPAWQSHLIGLTSAGVHLVYGADVWPLHEPGEAPGRQLPWHPIRERIRSAVRDS